MELLVTGANGFVGHALCAEAAARHWKVRAATRCPCRFDAAIENIVVGEVDGNTDWAAALQGVDVVIHLAARVHVMQDNAADPLAEFRKVNLEGTANLARQAARNGVRRFVYVSSIKVNGEATTYDSRFTESGFPAPQDPYGASKWEAEQILHQISDETGLEVVIVRPPLVYGEEVKGNFSQMLSIVEKAYPLPFASIRNLRSLIYVGNLADALLACATRPEAAGQTYLVSDGEDLSTPDLIRLLANFMDVPSRLFPCPSSLLQLAGRATGKSRQIERLLGSLRVDSAKIRRDLNWVPPYSLQQGLQATAEWYRDQHT